MNTLFIYIIILLVHLNIYLFLKHNIENLSLFNYPNYNSVIENEVIEKDLNIPMEPIFLESLTNDFDENKQIILKKSLMHLEFISTFEMYLEDKNYKKFPIEFLQEFEKIKIEAQLSALKSTSQLTNSTKLAA